MQDGLLFRVECDQGVTGMVLVGRGELRFSPALGDRARTTADLLRAPTR